MKRPLLVAALLSAMSGVASAGIYGGLSVGPDAAVQDDVLDLTSSGRAARLIVGYRMGPLSAEASLMGNTLRDYANQDVDHRQIALLGKYNFSLGSNFELFGRAGIQRTMLTAGAGAHDIAGNGIVFGPGIEYVLKFATASAAIRLDYTISYANGQSSTFPVEDGLSFTSVQWMLGFTVGM